MGHEDDAHSDHPHPWQRLERFPEMPGPPIEQAQPPSRGAEVEPAEVYESALGHPSSTVLKSIAERSWLGGKKFAMGALLLGKQNHLLRIHDEPAQRARRGPGRSSCDA